ncbi:hypothetical protein Tco_0758574 [Tanacetum coccineum]
MENPNHPNEPNEAIPEVNPFIPEPNHVKDAHDPNKMVDIPDNEELVDYDGDDEEDPVEENLKKKPKEDNPGKKKPNPNNGHGKSVSPNFEPIARMFEMEVDDDAYFIGDVSSDSESEDEEIDVAPEVDVAPEATIGTSTQKPYAIRDFLEGLYEVGESSSARDSSHVGGLAP